MKSMKSEADRIRNEINKILKITSTSDAPERLWVILRDWKERELVFKQMLDLFEGKLDIDWFEQYFQNNFADGSSGQVFTSMHIAQLMAQLTLENNGAGMIRDSCAGTGALIIGQWLVSKQTESFKPSDYCFICEERDDRLIPFLIFNLAVRGMNAIVIHCDTMTRQSWGAFYLHNIQDNPNGFSSITRLPYTEKAEIALCVKFKNHYPEQIEFSAKHLISAT